MNAEIQQDTASDHVVDPQPHHPQLEGLFAQPDFVYRRFPPIYNHPRPIPVSRSGCVHYETRAHRNRRDGLALKSARSGPSTKAACTQHHLFLLVLSGGLAILLSLRCKICETVNFLGSVLLPTLDALFLQESGNSSLPPQAVRLEFCGAITVRRRHFKEQIIRLVYSLYGLAMSEVK